VLGATLLAAERVYHKRHHLADVVVGGLMGTSASLIFYRFQQRQLESDTNGTSMPRDGPILGWSTAW